MKKRLLLSETDIKAVMAETFKVDPSNVEIFIHENDVGFSGITDYEVTVEITSEVQNYDV